MDRTFRGFIAGTIAGVILNIYNLICFYLLKIVDIRFIDWSGILIVGGKPETLTEIIYALVNQIIWDGFLGIIFAFLIHQIGYRGYLLKGVLFGFLLSFTFRSIAELYQIEFLASGKVSLETSMTNLIGVLLWGLLVAWILKRFEKVN